MTDKDDKSAETRRRWRRRAVALGFVLGLVCKSLPPEYQGPCDVLVSICTGGL